MKIIVLNGSPKGSDSITLQSCRFLEKKFPDLEFSYLDIGSRIKALKRDRKAWNDAAEMISMSDVLIWCFPVYHLLVPGQLLEFIEMVHEDSSVKSKFSGKKALSISTSAHFFDHLAHRFIQAVSEDLDMEFYDSLSAEMNDLLTVAGRHTLESFMKVFLETSGSKGRFCRTTRPLSTERNVFVPSGFDRIAKRTGPKVLILSDSTEKDRSLNNMIRYFKGIFPYDAEELNLNSIGMKGGCLGCCRCAYDGSCVYSDPFVEVFEQTLCKADIIIFAGTIRQRYLSSVWKYFWDRSFYNGHRPVLNGRQNACILSGPLKENPDIRADFTARAEISDSNLSGIVTDEDSAERVQGALRALSEKLVSAYGNRLIKPSTFPAVGGKLLFRDLVYNLKGFFRNDDVFYKKRGLYDYPYKKVKTHLINLLFRVMTFLPYIRKQVYGRAVKEMVKDHKSIVESSIL